MQIIKVVIFDEAFETTEDCAMILWVQDVSEAKLDIRVHPLVVCADTASRLVLVLTMFAVEQVPRFFSIVFSVVLICLSAILTVLILGILDSKEAL